MTFKKTNGGQWKMNHKKHTAYISRYYGSWSTTYYLNIDIEKFDGQYHETFRLVSEQEFYNLNEAKRFAKDYII